MKCLRNLLIAVALTLSFSLFAEIGEDAREKLNLDSMQVENITVYYEKSLKGKLPVFEKECKRLLAEQKRGKELLARKDDLLLEINSILGIAEPDARMQDYVFGRTLAMFSIEKQTFYVVKAQTIKDFLREGGKLANCTYDKTTDKVAYEFNAEGGKEGLKYLESMFPVSSEETFEKDIEMGFASLRRMAGSMQIGLALHEVIEMSLLQRARPQDPYWRWFGDGFANAIAKELLKKYAGAEIAEEYAESCAVDNYEDLEKEVNLRYWMSAKYYVGIEKPVERGERMFYARYAYATFEAQRLVDAHGIECVKEIMNEVSSKEGRTSEALMDAIKKVTGEDMRERLRRYQTFGTREEGMAKYEALYNAAAEENNYETMLVNLLRVQELSESPFSPDSLRRYKLAATLLFKLGHEEAGDRAMENCMEVFKSSPVPEGHDAAREMFLVYALECNNPLKARKVAEEFLTERPENVLSLTVLMLTDSQSGRIAEAKEKAEKILSLVKNPRSPSYKAAAGILGREPQ